MPSSLNESQTRSAAPTTRTAPSRAGPVRPLRIGCVATGIGFAGAGAARATRCRFLALMTRRSRARERSGGVEVLEYPLRRVRAIERVEVDARRAAGQQPTALLGRPLDTE